jgi:mRNA interferase RelE/StbE
MNYQVILPKKVQKDLRRVDSRYLNRIKAALVALAENPYMGKGLESKRAGQWSFEVWPYRIIYVIHKSELMVLVIRIGHRQGVY